MQSFELRQKVGVLLVLGRGTRVRVAALAPVRLGVVHDDVVRGRQEEGVVVVAEVPGVLGEAPGLRVLGRQRPVGRLLEDVVDDRRRVADREALRRLQDGHGAVWRLLGPVVLACVNINQ